MKKIQFTNGILAVLLLAVAMSIQNCKKDGFDSRKIYLTPIDPEEEPDLLGRAFDMTNATLREGDMPSSNASSSELVINYSQSGALVAAGTELYIPFTFYQANQLSGIYLQVNGADHYWDIRVDDPPSGNSGNYVFPLGIPTQALTGFFNIKYALYDKSGKISQVESMKITIGPVESACSGGTTYHQSGSEGLTVRRVELGNVPGRVKIEYEMYSLPDRLDIKYNGKWVASTAAAVLSDGAFPPPSVCYDGQVGYVSGDNVLEFDYDPQVSTEFQIYMSGCYGATAWDFWVTCPDNNWCGSNSSPLDGIRHKTFTVPGNTSGKLVSDIQVNPGDYVFVSAKGLAQLSQVVVMDGEPYVNISTPNGINDHADQRKYPNYQYGQLLVYEGFNVYPCSNYTLKGQDCPGLADEIYADNIVFFGEWGDYFISSNGGALAFEINDLKPEDNNFGYSVEIYILPRALHTQRNCYNKCPQKKPEFNPSIGLFQDTNGWVWDDKGLFDETIEDCYHGAENSELRGKSANLLGCQCVYSDATGALVNDNNEMGTFDFGYYLSADKRLHFILDVFPHVAFNGAPYEPTTFIY